MPDRVKLEIKLNYLEFDENNPRLPRRLQGIKDEGNVIDYMVRYGNIIELMLSIAETGYSEAEPLLVVENAGGKYAVIEGNRRLAALKVLNTPVLAKVRLQSIRDVISNANYIPDSIPCILYKCREDVLDYLGYRHITGVKEWGALEKARYLDQLYQIHIHDTPSDQIYRKLAKIIGSRSDYVFKLHTALKLYDKANDKAYYGADIKEEDIKFSWLTTALGYRGISEFIGLTDYNDHAIDSLKETCFEKLFTWMFFPGKAVVGEVREISKLAKVIEYPEAVRHLEKGSTLDEALLYTSAPSEAFMGMLTAAKQQLKQAKDAIEQLGEEPQEAQEILGDIEKLIKTIRGGLVANFSKINGELVDSLNLNMETLGQMERLLKLKQFLENKDLA